MLRLSARYPVVGEFPPAEVAFLDELFSSNAKRYGFFGEKVISELTAQIPERERVKMPGTGHFLFRGDSQQVYSKLQKDLGRSVILTSGIRSVVKQTHLFWQRQFRRKGICRWLHAVWRHRVIPFMVWVTSTWVKWVLAPVISPMFLLKPPSSSSWWILVMSVCVIQKTTSLGSVTSLGMSRS